MDEPTELITFLAPYPDHVQSTMLEGRAFLLNLFSPVNELHYDATSAVCAAISYTEKTRDVFVNLAAYSNHVTLVFGFGKGLNDPKGLLKGEGNQVRHIQLRQGMKTLQDPAVLDLIEQANDRAVRLAGDFVPTRIIKIYEGPKRRPTKS